VVPQFCTIPFHAYGQGMGQLFGDAGGQDMERRGGRVPLPDRYSITRNECGNEDLRIIDKTSFPFLDFRQVTLLQGRRLHLSRNRSAGSHFPMSSRKRESPPFICQKASQVVRRGDVHNACVGLRLSRRPFHPLLPLLAFLSFFLLLPWSLKSKLVIEADCELRWFRRFPSPSIFVLLPLFLSANICTEFPIRGAA